MAEFPADLFRTHRGVTAADAPFYVGVRLSEPAFLRLLALDDRGEFHPLSLGTDGAGTERFPAQKNPDDFALFGPFEGLFTPAGGTGERRVMAVFVLSSRGAILPARLDRALGEQVVTGFTNLELQAIAGGLGRRLGCGVTYRRP